MNNTHTRNVSTLLIGALLIGAGVLAFIGQLFHHLHWDGLWPFIVIGAGALFFGGMFFGGKQASGLAIPGSVVTTVGLVLLVQNITGWWQSWSYAWTLIVAGVGAGIAIEGAYSGSPERKSRGLALVRTGLTLFAAFGIFFEFLYAIVGLTPAAGKIIWPAALIALSVFLLAYRVVAVIKNSTQARGKNLFWPFMLLAAGLLALFAQVGWLSASQLAGLLNFWPLLLVGAGLQLIGRGLSPWYGAAMGVLVLIALLGLAFFGPQLGLANNPLWMVRLGGQQVFTGLQTVRGQGALVQETRSGGEFDAVTLAINGRVEITQGDETSVMLSANENLLPFITVRTSSGELLVGVKNGYNLTSEEPILVRLTVQDLSVLNLDQAGEVSLQSIRTEHLRVASNGVGSVQLSDLQAGLLEIEINGGAVLTATGEVEQLELQNNGLGRLDAAGLHCQDVDVRINGFGNATVWAVDHLSVRIEGAGSVSYYGSPVVRREINGLGSVNRLGSK